MTNQEAQFILDAYRPDGRDAGAPMFAEALKQAERDPALRDWFAREQKHAGTVTAKLREFTPPPGLREAILAGGRVSKTPVASTWTRARWLAIAASVVVLISLGSVWRWSTHAPLARLETFAVNDTRHGAHGSHGAATSALIAKLSQSDTRLAQGLPIDFATLRLSGCRTLNFGGRDILEVCFEREGGEFHLYMTRLEDFPGVRGSATPQFGEREGLAVASWADAAYRYVLVSAKGVAAVQRLM